MVRELAYFVFMCALSSWRSHMSSHILYMPQDKEGLVAMYWIYSPISNTSNSFECLFILSVPQIFLFLFFCFLRGWRYKVSFCHKYYVYYIWYKCLLSRGTPVGIVSVKWCPQFEHHDCREAVQICTSYWKGDNVRTYSMIMHKWVTTTTNRESVELGTESIWYSEFCIPSVFLDNLTIINQELDAVC